MSNTTQRGDEEQVIGDSDTNLQCMNPPTQFNETSQPPEDPKEHDTLHLPQPTTTSTSQDAPSYDPPRDPALNYALYLNLQYPYLTPTAQSGLGIHDMSQYSQQPEQLLVPAGLPTQEFESGEMQVVHVPTKGRRKSRWRPTPAQKALLEGSWAQNQYPDRLTKQNLATDLGITAEQVSRWFKHRRENYVHKGTKRNPANTSPMVPILSNPSPSDTSTIMFGKLTYRNEAAAKFTNEQVATLESMFKEKPYPQKEDIANMAAQIGVSQQRVKNWFKAHRCRLAQKGSFEFKRGQVPVNRKRKTEVEAPLIDEEAKRQELATEELVDIVDEDNHHQITATANVKIETDHALDQGEEPFAVHSVKIEPTDRDL